MIAAVPENEGGKLGLLCHSEEDEHSSGTEEENTGTDSPYLDYSFVRHDEQYKAQHEAVSVIEPVGALKSVPYEIDGTDKKAQKEECHENAGAYLFPCRISWVAEEHRDKQYREHAAVDEWQTLRPYGVIGAWQELYKHIENVEVCLEVPVCG